MITMETDMLLFLGDSSQSFYSRENDYEPELYVKQTLDNGYVVLYKSMNKKLSLCNLSFSAIFNTNTNTIVLVNDNHIDFLFETVLGEIECLNIREKTRELNGIVEKELEAILSLSCKPSVVVSKDIVNEAREMFLNGVKPAFSFAKYKMNLTLENVVEFLEDAENLAYTFAEECVENDEEILEEYQKYIDLLTEIEKLENTTPFELIVEQDISFILNNTNYKNVTITLEDGVTLMSVDKEKIKYFPYYAIKTIHWGRKLIFDIDTYDKVDVDKLRENSEYNIKAFDKVKSSYNHKDDFCRYVDKRMYSCRKFAEMIAKNAPTYFEEVDKSIRECISFIQQANLPISTVLKNVSEQFILTHKDYFIPFCVKDKYVYESLPRTLQLNPIFLVPYIDADYVKAMSLMDKVTSKIPEVQLALVNAISIQPRNVYHSRHEETLDCFGLIEDRYMETKLNLLTLNNFKYLDLNLRNNDIFVKMFLDKIAKSSDFSREKTYYERIYEHLVDLKTDLNICIEILNVAYLDESTWRMIDSNITSNPLFQEEVAILNPQLLYLLEENLKRKYILNNIDNLQYYTKKSKGASANANIPNDFWIEIAKSTLTKPSNLSAFKSLHYSQGDDIKFAKELLKINPKIFYYLGYDAKRDDKLAMIVTDTMSIIPMLPERSWGKSLFDNVDIMKRSLVHSPRDFGLIPKSDKRKKIVSLIDDYDFVEFAITLYGNNVYYLPTNSPFRENEKLAIISMLDDITNCDCFANKLFRSETFVTTLFDDLLKKYGTTNVDILEQMKNCLLPLIPKKIKETNSFKAKYSMLF